MLPDIFIDCNRSLFTRASKFIPDPQQGICGSSRSFISAPGGIAIEAEPFQKLCLTGGSSRAEMRNSRKTDPKRIIVIADLAFFHTIKIRTGGQNFRCKPAVTLVEISVVIELGITAGKV